jgi:hypothetical protein
MQEYFFIRFMTTRTNYSLLFMLIKMSVKKKDKFFFKQNLELFLEPFTLKTKGYLMVYFHQRPHCRTQEQIIYFSRKKITKELQDFKSKLF